MSPPPPRGGRHAADGDDERGVRVRKLVALAVATAGAVTGLVAARRTASARAEADLWAEATDPVTTPSAALDSRPVVPDPPA